MKTIIFLRKSIVAGIFVVFTLTLLGNYENLFYPFGRNIIFQAITEILLLFYFALIYIDKTSRPNLKSPIVIGVLSFWFLNFLAFLFSVDRTRSFFGDPGRMSGFFNLSHALIFFFILTGILKSWRDWQKIFYLIILISIPAGLGAVWQKFFVLHGLARAYGTLDNPDFLAAYLLFPIFLTLVFLFLRKKMWEKTFLAAALFLQLIALYFALSRGAMIALAFGLLLFVLLKPQWRVKFKIVIIGILLLVGSGFLALNFGYIKNQLQLKNNYYRLEIWRNAILGIEEKPIFGWGQENFQMAFDKYYKGDWEQKETMGEQTDKAHNLFLEAGATTGIVGLIGYLGVWLIAFWLLFRKKSPVKSAIIQDAQYYDVIKTGVIAILSAYFIQGLFNIETLIPSLYFWVFIGFINFLSKDNNAAQLANAKSDINKINISKKIGFASAALILTGLVIFSVKNYHLDPLLANFYQNKANSITLDSDQKKLNGLDPKTKEKIFHSAFDLYKKALGNPSFIDPYIRFNYASSMLIYANFSTTSKEEAKNLVGDGLRLLDKNFAVRPLYTRDWWLAGKLSGLEIGLAKNQEEKEFWLGKSSGYFGNAIKLSPDRPMMLTEWGEVYLNAGKTKDAREKFTQAIAINADTPNPHWFLALSYIQEKNWQEFEKEMNLAKKLGWDITDQNGALELTRFAKLVNAFLAQQEYARLADLYEKAITIESQNAQFYISLAVTYKEAGQKEKARQTIERLVRINPALSEHPQIIDFLKNL